MSVNAYGANFPPGVPGQFYDLLLALWQRTGGATGTPIVNTGLTATGSTAADALALIGDWNEIDTVVAGAGVIMPPMVPGEYILIFNQGGGSALLVYPPGGMNIDALAPAVAYSLPSGKMQCFRVLTLTQIHSTQFG